MDLNESVMVVIESFRSALKDKNIAIEVSLEGTSPIISADRSQMEQVLSNIMKNSIESVANEMTKPDIKGLKHEDILSNAIINAKDKSVVSWWWLSIPVFIILMLLMKSVYMPGTTLISNIHELASREKYMSIIFFLLSPVVLIIVNTFSIRKIYIISENPKSINFLKTIWFNILTIVLSILILIIYSL